MAHRSGRPSPGAAGEGTDAEASAGPLPSADRPRERLLSSGPRALSDADLVALLLPVSPRDASPRGREIRPSPGPHDPAGAEVAS